MASEISKDLRQYLESDCPHGMESLLEARRKEDFEALQGLLSVEESVDPTQRSRAIHMLGRWADPASAAPICKLLPDLKDAERVTAIDALGRLGTSEALQGVLDCADDPSPTTRKFVAYALARFEGSKARSKLEEIASKDPVDWVSAAAAKRL